MGEKKKTKRFSTTKFLRPFIIGYLPWSLLSFILSSSIIQFYTRIMLFSTNDDGTTTYALVFARLTVITKISHRDSDGVIVESTKKKRNLEFIIL